MNKKFEQVGVKRFKKEIKTEIKNDRLRQLRENLMALKVFGGVVGVKIPFEVEESKIDELEMIFQHNYGKIGEIDFEKEAEEMLQRYNREEKKVKIKELNKQLEKLTEGSEEFERVLKEIWSLQKTRN